MADKSKNWMMTYFSNEKLVLVGVALLLIDVALFATKTTGAGVFSAVAALIFGLGAAANLLKGNPEGKMMNIITFCLAIYFFIDIVIRISS